MPRIVGVDVPANKQAKYALTYIKGIGVVTAEKILTELKLDPIMRAKDLTEEQVSQIAGLIEKKYTVEGELGRQLRDNIKRLKDIGTYRGVRHTKGLPVRGQKTRSNARTRKGKKQTVGGVSVRKAVSKT